MKLKPISHTYPPYSGCKFCRGKGCIGCESSCEQDESDAARARQDQERLEKSLLFSAKLNPDGTFADPQEAAVLKQVFSRDALTELFTGAEVSEAEVIEALGGPGALWNLRRNLQETHPHYSVELATQELIDAKRLEMRNEWAMRRLAVKLDAAKQEHGVTP